MALGSASFATWFRDFTGIIFVAVCMKPGFRWELQEGDVGHLSVKQFGESIVKDALVRQQRGYSEAGSAIAH